MTTQRGEVQAWLRAALAYNGNSCLEWPFARTSKGYGRFSRDGGYYRAHRVICEATHGPAPDDIAVAAHSCHNPACCNPSHLRWATPKENSADKVKDGTLLVREQHPNAKLTDAAVVEIRQMPRYFGSGRDLADKFGVSQQAISNVRNGRVWIS